MNSYANSFLFVYEQWLIAVPLPASRSSIGSATMLGRKRSSFKTADALLHRIPASQFLIAGLTGAFNECLSHLPDWQLGNSYFWSLPISTRESWAGSDAPGSPTK